MRLNARTASPSPLFLSITESCLLVLLLVLFVVKGLIPGWAALHSDFANYYIVARLLHEHWAMDRIYDWIWLQRVKDHWSIQQPLLGFLGLTPFSALPIYPLAWLDALEAKRVWLVLNLAIFASVFVALQRITSLGYRRIILIAFLCIVPLRSSFQLGQMHILVLALMVLAYYLYERQKWAWCGLVLGVAASLKVYPLLFVIYFLRKRKWTSAAVLAISTLVIFAACFLVFGAPAMRVFAIEQFPRMLRGEATDSFSLFAPSASTILHRIFLIQPQTNPHPLISSPLLYAVLYPFWQLLLLGSTFLVIPSNDKSRQHTALEWACWVCLLLTLSTQPASYHAVALIMSAVLAIYSIESTLRKGILLSSYFVACNIHPHISPQHPVADLLLDSCPYWSLLAMWFCLFSALLHTRSRSAVLSSTSPLAMPTRQLAWSIAAFVTIWSAVSATTFAHLRSVPVSGFLRDRSDGGYAYFGPHTAGHHLLSVGMFMEGYRVEDENGMRLQTSNNPNQDDQLAIASGPNANYVWIEVASPGQSHLVELQVDEDTAKPRPIAEIPDGESPSLSADGRQLLFLRDSRGRGSAWTVQLDGNGNVLDSPTQINTHDMDVQSAEFANQDTVVFSALDDGTPHLFLSQAKRPPQRIFSEDDAMDSPAMLAGNRLVYRKRSGSNWHLFLSDLSRPGAIQLTFGDCNARDPEWRDNSTLIYTSDCGRGNGISALATVHGDVLSPPIQSLPQADLRNSE